MKTTINTLVALAALATPVVAQECGEGMRAIEDTRGTHCIPVEPERIVALRGDSIATPLIEMGAPLVAAAFRVGDDGTPWLRGASDIFGDHAVEVLGLMNVGSAGRVDLEAVASTDPDLIIITQYQTDLADQLSAIAPVINTDRGMSFFERLEFLAEAAGMPGFYDDRKAAYDDRIAEAQTILGDPSLITVSGLTMNEEGLEYFPNFGGVHMVIKDIGFGQPPLQAEATGPLRAISPERMMEFDGDVILSSYSPRFGQSVEFMKTERFDGLSPLWRELSAVRSGNHFWFEYDIWNGTTFASLDAVIDGLTLLTAGRTFD